MFSDFKQAFADKSDEGIKVPREVLKSLTEGLPEGYEYTDIQDGYCTITPIDTDNIEMEIMIDIEKHIMEKFKITTLEELFEYMYRTQRKLETPLNKDGDILINGVSFKTEELIKAPLSSENIGMKYILIEPNPFPKPFEIKIKAQDIEKSVWIQRQPYEDMKRMLFRSIENSIFEMTYIVDEKENRLNLTFNLNREKSDKVLEIVEGLKLYRSALSRELEIAGSKIFEMGTRKKMNNESGIKESIEFWDGILSIENFMNQKFEVKFPILIKDYKIIEKMNRSFIQKKPFKELIEMDKMTMDINDEFVEGSIVKGSGMMIKFIESKEVEIWGAQLKVHAVKGVFNFRIKDYILSKERKTIDIITEPINDEGIYQSERYFDNMEEAEEYLRNENLELKNAELLEL